MTSAGTLRPSSNGQDEPTESEAKLNATGDWLKMLAAIHTVARGESLLSPAITRRLIEAFVQRPPDGTRTPPPELQQLTPREADILRLIARGLSNAEIAAAAFVSEATVKTHVARILMKLGLRDRVQVVVYAYEHRLV